MANLQGFRDKSLQGLRNSLQGFGVGGYIYIANLFGGPIRVYALNGTTLDDISNVISGISYTINGISVYNNQIYVCSSTADPGSVELVHVFNRDGTHVRSFGNRQLTSSLPDPGELTFPRAIAAYGGYVFVSDYESPSGVPFVYISKFTTDGDYVSRFGAFGSSDGEFGYGPYIYCYNDEIYACDFVNDRVQVFDLDGNFLRKWGSSGSGDGEFSLISDVYVKSGVVYVCDGDTAISTSRIQLFDTSGNYLDQFGSFGSGDVEFKNAKKVRSANSNIYVLDTNNDRMQIITPSYDFISEFSDNMSTPLYMDIG